MKCAQQGPLYEVLEHQKIEEKSIWSIRQRRIFKLIEYVLQCHQEVSDPCIISSRRSLIAIYSVLSVSASIDLRMCIPRA